MTDELVQVTNFLKANPDFLIENQEILAFVTLPEQGSGNVTSLHERQVQTLREKIKLLEHRVVTMTHAAIENQEIINKGQLISQCLLAVKNVTDLPVVLIEQIKQHFIVPIVCLNLWNQADDTSQEEKLLIGNMRSLYCGFADQAPTLTTFRDEEVMPSSVVLIPLRSGIDSEVFGCLSLGSHDQDRFSPTLGLDFLNLLAQTACAALSRLQPISI